MLVSRVRSVEPDFAVTPANAAAVTEICLRLDGLPLALELAAARAKLFTPAELATRLRQRMTVLTRNARDAPVRHRSLRDGAGMEPRPARTGRTRGLPAAVGVRRGMDVGGGAPGLRRAGRSTSWRRSARWSTRAWCDARPGSGTSGSSSLLESLREYAAELLAEHDDREPTRARHAAYFADRRARRWRPASGGRPRRSGGPGPARRPRRTCRRRSTTRWPPGTPRPRCRSPPRWAGTPTSGATSAPDGPSWNGRWPRPGTAQPPPADALAGALVIAGVLAWTVGDLERAPELLRRGAGDQRGGR